MPRYDKVFFINVTQDLAPAKAEHLSIHNDPVIFIKVPPNQKLISVLDNRFESLTHHSKVYFSAHGSEKLEGAVLDRNSVDATIYKIDEVVDFFSKMLNKDEFKNPNQKPRLTLVLSACEGLGFAKNLQKKLHEKHGIYVDVVGNKYVTHDYYNVDDETQTVDITYRTTSVKTLNAQEHHRPHSKVLLTINEKGVQKEIDAYEFKWVLKTVNAIEDLYNSFNKWMDKTNEEHIEVALALKNILQDILSTVGSGIHKNLSDTANKVLVQLMSCFDPKVPAYFPATKFELFFLTVANLIAVGKEHVNLNQEGRLALLRSQYTEAKMEASQIIEVLQRTLNMKKSDYFYLLEKASSASGSELESLKQELNELSQEIATLKLDLASSVRHSCEVSRRSNIVESYSSKSPEQLKTLLKDLLDRYDNLLEQAKLQEQQTREQLNSLAEKTKQEIEVLKTYLGSS